MSAFEFKNLVIERLIAHSIKVKEPEGRTLPVLYNDLLDMDQESKSLIQIRMTDALGKTSHGVEMDVDRNGEDDFSQVSATMLNATDAAFVEKSQKLAEKLQEAQTSARWPAGVLIVLSGTVGEQKNKFVAVIKAETDKGFNVVENGGKLKLEMVKNMLLAASQRLYKIGILVQVAPLQRNTLGAYEPDCFKCFLFDHLLKSDETGNPASYFYQAFLGMKIKQSDRHKTKLFYEQTRKFINHSELDDSQQAELREALRSTLRSNELTINATDFAEEYLPENLHEAYMEHMLENDFPDHSVVKNLEYIRKELRKPRATIFTTGVRVIVPADGNPVELIQNLGIENGHTNLKIKGIIQDSQ